VTPTSPTFSRASLSAFALAVAALASACYKPSITDGGFACSSVYKQECPTGYVCDATGRCRLPSTAILTDGSAPKTDADAGDAKLDVPGDVAMEAPVDKPDGSAPDGTPADAIACINKPSPCTSVDAGMCDPMCSTGCGRCDQKCSVNTANQLTCNAPSGTLVRQAGESCTIVSGGSAAQTDNCAAGLVCIQASCGASCFKFCRVDADCPGSECSRTLTGGTQKYCDVPAVTCNPVALLNGGVTGCPAAAQGCYLSATVPDETRCDCPFAEQREGDDCTVSRQCLRGLVCADPTGQNHFVCARACKLNVPAGMQNGCAAPTTCLPIKTSKTYGFCG
jgi:hypothetical protein